MIDSFKGEYSFLSNMYICDVWFENAMYISSEHAYVAAKTKNMDVRQAVRDIQSPYEAKRYGRKHINLRSDWEDVKLDVMKTILTSKFTMNHDLKYKLISTSFQELVEGNTWGDTFWGKCDGYGQNHLGKILMEVRDEIKYDIRVWL